MTLQLSNVRAIAGADELSELDKAQLYQVGTHFDGVDRSAEDRFVDLPVTEEAEAEGIDWDDGNFKGQLLFVAEVHEDGVHRWDVWVHHADNGCLFEKGTAIVVAGRVQSQWMTPDLAAPHPLAELLDSALRAKNIY